LPLQPLTIPTTPEDALKRAETYALQNLLNCYVREVAGPDGRARVTREGRRAWLTLTFPHADEDARVPLEHVSSTGNHTYGLPVEAAAPGGPWRALTWKDFLTLVTRELEARTGVQNGELAAQVQDSVRVTSAALMRATPPPALKEPLGAYLASEQSLIVGHRFHPAPKARPLDANGDWRRYAPELHASFQLHYFAARRDDVRGASLLPHDTLGLLHPGGGACPELPDDRVLLPVHPWQVRHARQLPAVRRALREGRLQDVGPLGPQVHPTASVRTILHPHAPYFLKFSLHARLTNCVRKNAHYELESAVHLSRVLAPALAQLTAQFPGVVVLPEPAFATLDLGGTPEERRDTQEAFGVILREGLTGHLRPGEVPVLAAALFGNPASSLPALLDAYARASGVRPREAARAWFRAYVRRLLPPVLHAFLAAGVVFEPHLQNVVVTVADGAPARVFLRDLEGTKLIPERTPPAWWTGLSEAARASLAYDEERGWRRVAYCLLVNHLAEVVAALATLTPGQNVREDDLWSDVHAVLREYAREHGANTRVRALLRGEAWPAKTNLLTRFTRRADREAGYVPLPSPLASLGVTR